MANPFMASGYGDVMNQVVQALVKGKQMGLDYRMMQEEIARRERQQAFENQTKTNAGNLDQQQFGLNQQNIESEIADRIAKQKQAEAANAPFTIDQPMASSLGIPDWAGRSFPKSMVSSIDDLAKMAGRENAARQIESPTPNKQIYMGPFQQGKEPPATIPAPQENRTLAAMIRAGMNPASPLQQQAGGLPVSEQMNANIGKLIEAIAASQFNRSQEPGSKASLNVTIGDAASRRADAAMMQAGAAQKRANAAVSKARAGTQGKDYRITPAQKATRLATLTKAAADVQADPFAMGEEKATALGMLRQEYDRIAAMPEAGTPQAVADKATLGHRSWGKNFAKLPPKWRELARKKRAAGKSDAYIAQQLEAQGITW